ncbi:MAG: WYL domain-containing protein [Ruminiclostridium sp.]|nr:WYL domain-containing protein [Ruminiclostridium sp.]
MTDNGKSNIQRLKVMYLYKILFENTDENHKISMPEILSELEQYGITAGRKGIYEDIEALRTFGAEIIGTKGSNSGYYLVNRTFELSELKVLADEVSSSKFLTEKRSRELIKKLETLTNIHSAKQLQRQVYVVGRGKTQNEQTLSNVDILHRAIAEKRKISFAYFDYDTKKHKKYRSGKRTCSPYALTFSNEQYYLVARYDKRPDLLTNFRVDRMERIDITDEPFIKADPDFKISEYLKSTFSMFSGHSEPVRLCFENSLINAVIDRFGKDITILSDDNEHFAIWTDVQTEQPAAFFSWLFLFGTQAEIVEPPELKQQYSAMLHKVADKYK